MSTDIILPPSTGRREPMRPVDAARLTDRLMACAGGCGKNFRVGPGVALILCGRETCQLARVREKRRAR